MLFRSGMSVGYRNYRTTKLTLEDFEETNASLIARCHWRTRYVMFLEIWS